MGNDQRRRERRIKSDNRIENSCAKSTQYSVAAIFIRLLQAIDRPSAKHAATAGGSIVGRSFDRRASAHVHRYVSEKCCIHFDESECVVTILFRFEMFGIVVSRWTS